MQLGGKPTNSRVLLLTRESYSWSIAFNHWGDSKLEKMFKLKIIYHHIETTRNAQNYFGKVKVSNLPWIEQKCIRSLMYGRDMW